MNKTSIKKKLSQETGTGFIRLNKTKQYDVDEVATVIAESIERVSVQ